MERRPAGGEGIHQPRPGDVGEERIRADLRFERCLREADDPPRASPCLRFVGIMQDDDPSRSERGVDTVVLGAHISGEGDRLRGQCAGRGDLSDDEVIAEGSTD